MKDKTMILSPPTAPDQTSIGYYHWKKPNISVFSKAWWSDIEWNWLQNLIAQHGEPDVQEALNKPQNWSKACWSYC